MSSKARKTFEKNAKDVSRLIEFHEQAGGVDRGRREKRLEVLNKSGIVLTCAVWEAYVEDLAGEVINHYVNHGTADKLPQSLRESVAKDLKADTDKEAPWKLAGEGWQKELRSQLKKLQAQRNYSLNTPKAAKVDEFFESSLGIADVSATWRWQNMTPARARTKLDDYVSLRGDIAHRSAAASSVQRNKVEDFRDHVERLVEATDIYINEQLRAAIGKALF